MARRKKRKRVTRSNPTRSIRFSPAALAALHKTAEHTGLSGNRLANLALETALATESNRARALRSFTELLAAAAADKAAKTRARKLTAEPARAMREATARLRAATGDAHPPVTPRHPPRQSA